MNYDTCVSCHSTDVREIVYVGFFEFEGKRYPLKTKYTKCNNCNTEYISKCQIKENQQYIFELNSKEEYIKPH